MLVPPIRSKRSESGNWRPVSVSSWLSISIKASAGIRPFSPPPSMDRRRRGRVGGFEVLVGVTSSRCRGLLCYLCSYCRKSALIKRQGGRRCQCYRSLLQCTPRYCQVRLVLPEQHGAPSVWKGLRVLDITKDIQSLTTFRRQSADFIGRHSDHGTLIRCSQDSRSAKGNQDWHKMGNGSSLKDAFPQRLKPSMIP